MAVRMRSMRMLRLGAFVATSLTGVESFAAAAECTQPDAPIETDRPDVTDSPIVVPPGSLQSENGIDTSRDHGADILNGTNSRWRLGIAPCLEVLVDLPNYFATLRGVGPSGFGDVAPAVKWQISPLPGKFDLSLTVGAGLPIGATGVAGDDRQQIDFHVGFGLDRNAPSYFFGLGYSFRIDGVLQQRDHASMHPLEATPRLNLVTK